MLLGYADGFGTGVLFGVMRPRMRGIPWFVAGAGLAVFTLFLSEGSATAMRKTDPLKWSAPDCVTCLVYDALIDK